MSSGAHNWSDGREDDIAMMPRTTRRQFVVASVLAAPTSLTMHIGSATAQGATVVGEAGAPDWSFTVVTVEDPYTGEVTRPQTPEPNTRFVSAQVIVTNGSAVPMQFEVADVHLVDANGDEYPAGSVIGPQPKLVGQNLPDGERSRGWVWYSVPNDAKVTEIRLYGPRPVFSVAIATTNATPVSG
jgi:hypothetical protein